VGEHPATSCCPRRGARTSPATDPFEAGPGRCHHSRAGRWLMAAARQVLGTAEGCYGRGLPPASCCRRLWACCATGARGAASRPTTTRGSPSGWPWTMAPRVRPCDGEPWFPRHRVPCRGLGTTRAAVRGRGASATCSPGTRGGRPELLTPLQAPAANAGTRAVDAPVGFGGRADALGEECGRRRTAAPGPVAELTAERLSVWAPQRLAPGERTLLSALGVGRDVTVWWPAGSSDDRHLLTHRLGRRVARLSAR